MANRLHWQLNEKCKLLRIGGDEFLLIAENTDTEEAMQLAEKVLHLIQDSYQISGKEINISASLGDRTVPRTWAKCSRPADECRCCHADV